MRHITERLLQQALQSTNANKRTDAVYCGLSPHVIRILINMCIAQQACISCGGSLSGYFSVLNGVRQGGVLSRLLLCVYIDDLLLWLARCGVGCYIGRNFVGALENADDIVLVCPTESAIRTLLRTFASEYSINFKALKYQILVCSSHSRHHKHPVKQLSHPLHS